ncbi:hypothetical protein AM571_CH00099 [Rhizobium etli 8C-3]|uniref:Uncharacterized protein n=1 Tax=Rhizobium etli 8C-3 TaxID=538025 RepID=A0A1L5NYJ2_RHIET|nr:hypothetical protein AM571_CH00099 [Rhizobium etli 8C-3]
MVAARPRLQNDCFRAPTEAQTAPPPRSRHYDRPPGRHRTEDMVAAVDGTWF